MRKSAAIFAGILLLFGVCASRILAATFFFQGFETDTTGWFNFSNGSIIGVPSGYTSGGGYVNGVASSSGSFHSRLRINPTDPDNPTCSPGSSDCIGPFTHWGGYEPVFPEPGYMTQVDIYLDVAFAATHPDYRFDWDSAINDFSGSFLRDFVFNVGTAPDGPAGFLVNASTNAFRNSRSRRIRALRHRIFRTDVGLLLRSRPAGGTRSATLSEMLVAPSPSSSPSSTTVATSSRERIGPSIQETPSQTWAGIVSAGSPIKKSRTSPSTTLSFARFRAQRQHQHGTSGDGRKPQSGAGRRPHGWL